MHLLLALQLALTPPGPASAADSLVFNGWQGEVDAIVPRSGAAVIVDGSLDEEPWRSAAVLTGFSQYEPVDGRPAEDSTDVLVWYSDRAIYFGIRAHELHGAVNTTLPDRDRIERDDNVQILLDTFDDERRALVFGMNPRGIQADGIRLEGVDPQQGRGERVGPVDLSRDFLFESVGRLTDYGYEIEVRIPFKSLRYPSEREQRWRLNVLRYVQHSGHLQTWTPAMQGRASFLAQSGVLEGLRDLDAGTVLDINPVATARVEGARATERWSYGTLSPELGGNVRWGVTEDLTVSGTINPDFSQVEADVGQITSNERFDLFFTEKRPFFLEGSERFETPNRLIHTRQIKRPVAAVRVTGRAARTSLGYTAAVDDETYSDLGRRAVYNLVRLQRDIGEGSTLGLVYTDRREGARRNSVAGVDARVVFAEVFTLAGQLAGSFDATEERTSNTPLWQLRFARDGRTLLLDYQVSGIHPDFVAGSGFINRPGVVHGQVGNSLRFYGSPGALVESWTIGTRFLGWWDYHGLWEGDPPQETKTFLSNALALRAGWSLSMNLGWETYEFVHDRYADYGIERTVGAVTDTIPWDHPRRINDVMGVIFRLRTPNFSRFSGELAVNRWLDVGFAEAASVHLLRMSAEANWRPTERVRINLLYSRLQLDRRRDGTNLSTQQIPRIKLEYQLTRWAFLRFVGQYGSTSQDALRDPRTDQPLLIRNPSSGVYTVTRASTVNDLRMDVLFSFQPNPGTVIFAGYGSSTTEPDAFHFTGLERTADAFFMKLSYLLRR